MSVPTFSQLLSEHLLRAGISDSELARSIGVRRQTVFRWKEGLVERPRARDDVLRCAKKLRLTPEERDLLLLSAGFAPEELSAEALRLAQEETGGTGVDEALSSDTAMAAQQTVAQQMVGPVDQIAPNSADALVRNPDLDISAADTSSMAANLTTGASDSGEQEQASELTLLARPSDSEAVITTASLTGTLPVQRFVAVAQSLMQRPYSRYIALGLLVGLFAMVLLISQGISGRVTPTPTPTRQVVQVTLNPPGLPPGTGFPAIFPKAQISETLLIVAPFRGYTVNEQYNVHGRIKDALVEEIRAANLVSTTIEIWPEEINNPAQLGPVLAASHAALIIWGEYDSGRVRVNLDGQRNITEKRDFPLSSPDELITTITSTLPKEIRILALNVLGQFLRNQGDFTKAFSAFEQAIRLKPEDPKTTARLYFYLGHMMEQGHTLADLDLAEGYYSKALEANDLLIDARYNRGTVTLNRSYLRTPDDPQLRTDLDAAIADLTVVMTNRSRFLDAYHNRGVAYYERNAEGDQAAAIADFSHIIAIEPENNQAYFHRALARLRANSGRGWIADFEQTLLLKANYYPAISGLCWGYALAEQPETALPFCDKAVDLDPTGASRDSRAIVYAQLGRYPEAIADFNTYLTWVESLGSPVLYERYRAPIVKTWITQLQASETPFDATLLDSLR